MFKDNGELNVELLAEVGDIAHRLRNLDEKLALNLDDPRYQQAIQHYGPASINRFIKIDNRVDNQCTDAAPVLTEAIAPSSSQSPSPSPSPSTSPQPPYTASPHQRRRSSAAQIAQNIGEKISDLGTASQQRRYSNKQVEDIILDFYEKHLIYHQNREKEKLVSSELSASLPPSCLFKSITDNANNMNNLPTTNVAGKCSTSDNHDNDPSNDGHPVNAAIAAIQNESLPPIKRNSIGTQAMPEIQISSIDEHTMKPRKSLTDHTSYINKEPEIGASDEKPIAFDGTSGVGVAGTCGHYCSGWQAALFGNQLSDDDLRILVMELKHKIEFTERMNWLYLSKRPAAPPHRKTSLPKHTEVKKRFMEICDRTLSDEIKSALRLPAFDSYEWQDEDVLFLMQTMFIDTGLVEKFNIPLATLREWLYEVYKHYNAVPFHNFRHCFCVAQMMYAIACRTNLSARIGDLEVLILLVSCICHDLDHPGYNNIYQINARTELALRYNDISPLENHHCSIAFRLLEHPECNIFKNFSKESFKEIREGIIRCILATDMARHNEIVTQFQEVSPNFDYSNESHINLLCMILIKVADISNEARPMDIAEPWLERLLQEFFAQSAAEKLEGLPVTPFMDPDKISKPGSQVRFIGLVILPLFEALGELLPELVEMIIQPVRDALEFYKRLNDAQNRSRKSLGEVDGSSDGGTSPQMPRSQSGVSVRSRKSIPSQKSTSRTSVDEPLCISAELHDLPEGSESGDSETATEVDIAEKTSKFKVDTEGNRNKNVPASSRKGSREKRPSMISELYTTGAGTRMRGSHGNIHNHHNNRSNFGANRAVSLDQYSAHNRRSSDGLQQVTSDNNVYYTNPMHRHDAPATVTETIKLNKSENTDISSSEIRSDSIANRTITPCSIDEKQKNQQSNPCMQQQQPANKYSSGKILSTASSAANNGTKSFMSRLRQFSSRFSFSFSDSKRTNATNSITITRNNNANESTVANAKGNLCCSHKSPSPLHQLKMDAVHASPIDSNTRNRAHSLDVVRTRQNSSSNSGDSRKSSRNDDHHHIMLMMEDNSNHTTTIGDNKSDADESFSAVCIAGDTQDTGTSI